MRDLERLHDVVEYRINASQLKLVFLGVLAVACAIFAVGVSVGKRLDTGAPALAADPLAELDRVAGAPIGVRAAAAGTDRQEAPALTYHDELTERTDGNEVQASAGEATEPTAPAAAGGSVVGSGPAVATPPDAPAQPEEEVPSEPAVLEEPAPGESAVYTLQVASFETSDEARQFATDLRNRGHRVFLVRTSTEDRGAWYRVRIGPFESRREATTYQHRFERAERLPTFLVRRAH
jgi:cell division septation protein DedD